MRAARVAALRAAVEHHQGLEASFLLAAERRPDEAIAWELAAEEQRGLADEARDHLRDLGEQDTGPFGWGG